MSEPIAAASPVADIEDSFGALLAAFDRAIAMIDEARRRAEIAEQRLDCLATLFKHAPLRQPVPGGPMFVTFSTAAFQMAYDGGNGQTQWREQESSTDV